MNLKLANKKRPKDLPVNFIFTKKEHDQLQKELLEIKSNPYFDYTEFRRDIINLSNCSNLIPNRYLDFLDKQNKRSKLENPFTVLNNVPVDKKIDDWHFDKKNPVSDKRKKKDTFVSESFLSSFAYLTEEEPYAYENVNTGDIHHDILPREGEENDQSQKGSGEIYYHKEDLANHPLLRPDSVNILALRSVDNRIITTGVRNIDIIMKLTNKELEVIKAPNRFHTPYDDLTIKGSENNKEVLSTDIILPHPLLRGDFDLNIFERRTRAIDNTDEIAKKTLLKIIRLMHENEEGVFLEKGVFLGTANNEGLHSKQFFGGITPSIKDRMERWLQKTVNISKEKYPINENIRGNNEWTVNG